MRERTAALFAAEKKLHIFVFTIIAIGLEIFLQINGAGYDMNRSSFVFASILFFFLFAILEYVF